MGFPISWKGDIISKIILEPSDRGGMYHPHILNSSLAPLSGWHVLLVYTERFTVPATGEARHYRICEVRITGVSVISLSFKDVCSTMTFVSVPIPSVRLHSPRRCGHMGVKTSHGFLAFHEGCSERFFCRIYVTSYSFFLPISWECLKKVGLEGSIRGTGIP